MNHQHFDIIESTQDYLLNNPQVNTLVSCDKQTAGHGQYGRKWDSYSGTLCFSFSFSPAEILSLTSLEVAVLIAMYFEDKYQLDIKLKWPNDLYFENEKAGGIILNSKNDLCIVGVGINIENMEPSVDYSYSSLFNKLNYSKKEIALDIFSFIIKNRLSKDLIVNEWEKKCIHMNQQVKIAKSSGSFIGVGKNGEALLEEASHIQSFFTGSLIFNS